MITYLAAPLAHETPEGRRRHRDRALFAARILGADVVPHRDIAPLACPGYPDLGETQEQRDEGMRLCLEAVRAADRLVILLGAHGWLTPGCREELAEYQRAHPAMDVPVYAWESLLDESWSWEKLAEWAALR